MAYSECGFVRHRLLGAARSRTFHAASSPSSTARGSETFFAGLLADDDVISRPELRVRVQAREIVYEHYDLLSDLCAEYRLDLLQATGVDPACPKASRRRMIAFADRIPSVRIAIDVRWSCSATRPGTGTSTRCTPSTLSVSPSHTAMWSSPTGRSPI